MVSQKLLTVLHNKSDSIFFIIKLVQIFVLFCFTKFCFFFLIPSPILNPHSRSWHIKTLLGMPKFTNSHQSFYFTSCYILQSLFCSSSHCQNYNDQLSGKSNHHQKIIHLYCQYQGNHGVSSTSNSQIYNSFQNNVQIIIIYSIDIILSIILSIQEMFFIIDGDKPIYELLLIQPERNIKDMFLLHASLDSVQSTLQTKKDYHIGLMKNQEAPIYCYVNCINLKFMLMFNRETRNFLDKKAESSIKQFFIKTNELMSLLLLNPLYTLHKQIKITSFDDRMKDIAKELIKPIADRKK